MLSFRADYVETIKRLIEAQIEGWKAGLRAPAPRSSVLDRVERRHLTGELGALFDAVLQTSVEEDVERKVA